MAYALSPLKTATQYEYFDGDYDSPLNNLVHDFIHQYNLTVNETKGQSRLRHIFKSLFSRKKDKDEARFSAVKDYLKKRLKFALYMFKKMGELDPVKNVIYHDVWFAMVHEGNLRPMAENFWGTESSREKQSAHINREKIMNGALYPSDFALHVSIEEWNLAYCQILKWSKLYLDQEKNKEKQWKP